MVFTSKPLRAEQGIDQVNKQAEAGNTRNDVVHRFVPYSLSQALVKAQQTIRKMQPMAR
jgi:hypothetical protein